MASSKKLVKNQPDLSIVIPAYCEEKRIGKSLDELASFLKLDTYFRHKDTEVIIVAAEAPDKTHEIIESKQRQFQQLVLLSPGPHVGKGRDVQYGMLRANGKYIVFMDADLATPLHHLKDFYKGCEQGSDIVIGTRDLFRFRKNRLRNLFSGIGNRLFQIASNIHIEDTQCGFKMFTQTAVQLCFNKLTLLGWGFDLEVLVIAETNTLSVTPIRIEDWEDKPYSTYTDGTLRISIRSIRDFVHISINRALGEYLPDK